MGEQYLHYRRYFSDAWDPDTDGDGEGESSKECDDCLLFNKNRPPRAVTNIRSTCLTHSSKIRFPRSKSSKFEGPHYMDSDRNNIEEDEVIEENKILHFEGRHRADPTKVGTMNELAKERKSGLVPRPKKSVISRRQTTGSPPNAIAARFKNSVRAIMYRNKNTTSEATTDPSISTVSRFKKSVRAVMERNKNMTDDTASIISKSQNPHKKTSGIAKKRPKSKALSSHGIFNSSANHLNNDPSIENLPEGSVEDPGHPPQENPSDIKDRLSSVSEKRESRRLSLASVKRESRRLSLASEKRESRRLSLASERRESIKNSPNSRTSKLKFGPQTSTGLSRSSRSQSKPRVSRLSVSKRISVAKPDLNVTADLNESESQINVPTENIQEPIEEKKELHVQNKLSESHEYLINFAHRLSLEQKQNLESILNKVDEKNENEKIILTTNENLDKNINIPVIINKPWQEKIRKHILKRNTKQNKSIVEKILEQKEVKTKKKSGIAFKDPEKLKSNRRLRFKREQSKPDLISLPRIFKTCEKGIDIQVVDIQKNKIVPAKSRITFGENTLLIAPRNSTDGQLRRLSTGSELSENNKKSTHRKFLKLHNIIRIEVCPLRELPRCFDPADRLSTIAISALSHEILILTIPNPAEFDDFVIGLSLTIESSIGGCTTRGQIRFKQLIARYTSRSALIDDMKLVLIVCKDMPPAARKSIKEGKSTKGVEPQISNADDDNQTRVSTIDNKTAISRESGRSKRHSVKRQKSRARSSRNLSVPPKSIVKSVRLSENMMESDNEKNDGIFDDARDTLPAKIRHSEATVQYNHNDRNLVETIQDAHDEIIDISGISSEGEDISPKSKNIKKKKTVNRAHSRVMKKTRSGLKTVTKPEGKIDETHKDMEPEGKIDETHKDMDNDIKQMSSLIDMKRQGSTPVVDIPKEPLTADIALAISAATMQSPKILTGGSVSNRQSTSLVE